MTNQNELRIDIDVSEGKIRLGRKHAVAAFTDEVITWVCKDYLFAVQFPPDSPLQVTNQGKLSTMTMPKEAISSFPYKYTIAVFADNKVLILDPVLVPIPPRG
jgi:hypothetical protein